MTYAAILILLGVGSVAATTALALDIRANSPRPGGQRSGRRSRALALVTDILTVASALSLVVSLVLSAVLRVGAGAETATPLQRIAMTVLAVLLAAMGGGPCAVLILRLATRGQIHEGVNGGILVSGTGTPPSESNAPTQNPRRGLFSRRPRPDAVAATAAAAPVAPQAMGSNPVEVLRGGTTIGLLERIAITGAILAGFPEAIAVVIAIKGVGRFNELAAAEAKERFIIGTLASFVWACACALVVQ